MKATVRKFLAVGFGLAGFVLAFGLGSLLTMTTGIPLLGGLLNGVLVSMVLTVGMVSMRRFGTGTTMWFVFSLLAVPFSTLGPPGLYKVVIGILAGIIWDAIFFSFRKSVVGLFAGALISASAIMGLLMVALSLGLGEDSAVALQKYKHALTALIVINITVTIVGVFLGYQAYVSRLSKLSLFRDLQGEEND